MIEYANNYNPCFYYRYGWFGSCEMVSEVYHLPQDARKEEASVNSMEEENRRKKVDWLEERLTQRDEKIDGLYIELRKEQEEKIDWIHKCHEVELIQKESEVKKCEIRGCVKRMPPSDY